MESIQMFSQTSGSGERLRRREISPEEARLALRTAFVARFIVLREGRRTRAHRLIENLSWDADSTAEDLMKMFRDAFLKNGDKLQPVDRDIRRAREHAESSVKYFADQYLHRSTLSFREALNDYQRSNVLLFGEDPDNMVRKGGWRFDESTSCHQPASQG